MTGDGFYIDASKAERLGIIGRVKVYHNGGELKRVIAAKSGKNGFAEFHDEPPRFNAAKDEIVSKKVRGNIKITISPIKDPNA